MYRLLLVGALALFVLFVVFLSLYLSMKSKDSSCETSLGLCQGNLANAQIQAGSCGSSLAASTLPYRWTVPAQLAAQRVFNQAPFAVPTRFPPLHNYIQCISDKTIGCIETAYQFNHEDPGANMTRGWLCGPLYLTRGYVPGSCAGAQPDDRVSYAALNLKKLTGPCTAPNCDPYVADSAGVYGTTTC